MAKKLSDDGADVVLIGRDHGKLMTGTGSSRGKTKAIKCDFILEPESLESKIREALVFH